MKLSITFVLYNSRDVIAAALDSVYASKVNFDYEVLIVDNQSPDDSVEFIMQNYLNRPEIAAKTKLILNSSNAGYGRGHNLALQQAKGEYLLVLNTDVKLEPDNLQIMTEFMESRPDVGVATCKLLKENGQLDLAARRNEPDLVKSFFRLFGLQRLFPKWFGGYNMLGSDPEQAGEIGSCVGAYMFMSRKAYLATGGFDPRYFMYGEDLDLCRAVREAGFKVWWYPKTICWHFRGQSTKKTPQKMLRAFYQANWIYYKKWYSQKYYRLLDPFVYLANWGLYSVKSLQNLLRPEDQRYVSK
jgi:GT2 family glycosyltransferase